MNRLLWPGALIMLIGCLVVVDITMLVIASNDPSFAVDPSYDKTTRSDTASHIRDLRSCGWTVNTDVTPSEGGYDIRFQLRNAEGEPAVRTDVTLTAYHNARRNLAHKLMLTTDDTGVCTATIEVRRSGLWKFDFLVDPDSDRPMRTTESHMLSQGTNTP